MSKAIEKAGVLKPEIRLAQAISNFEAILSTHEKSSLHQARATNFLPKPADVMRLTAELDLRASGPRCYGPRLTNFLQGVQQFAALGDLVVGGSQNIIACSLWALVRLTLTVSELSCNARGTSDFKPVRSWLSFQLISRK
jgi:hypothetical protein